MKPVTVETVTTGYLITDNKSEWRRSVKRELRFISEAGDSFESHRQAAAADAMKLIIDLLPGNTLGSVDIKTRTAQIMADGIFISQEREMLMSLMKLTELIQETYDWDARVEAEAAQANEPPIRSYRPPNPQQPTEREWAWRSLFGRAEQTNRSAHPRSMPPPLPSPQAAAHVQPQDAVEVR